MDRAGPRTQIANANVHVTMSHSQSHLLISTQFIHYTYLPTSAGISLCLKTLSSGLNSSAMLGTVLCEGIAICNLLL